MMRSLFKGSLALLAALLGGCQSLPARGVLPEASLRIAKVTVIDPETRSVLPDRSVYVAGDRILAVVSEGERPPYRAARTLDGSGKFLVPGLMDMHVHLFLPEPAAPVLALMLANGVTGVREMSGDCWALAGAAEGCIGDYRRLAAQIEAGEVAGPELLSLASTIVMGPARVQLPAGVPSYVAPSTPAEGRQLVRYLHARGVDLIKTHDSIPGEVFRAMMDEARSLGIGVSGHVPYAANTDELIRLGFGSIEHARDLLYDCSRYGEDFRRMGSAYADRQPGAKRPDDAERMRRTVAEYDPALCASRMRSLAAAGFYVTPTHVTREMEARAAEPAYRDQPLRRYILPARNAQWQADLDETAAAPAELTALRQGFFRHGLTLTGLAHRAGVNIMAGTDANDTMIVPGFALHRELGLLVQAGLSPMEALRAATSVPAAYLRRTATLGGISPGKEADLLLLRANPLDDIANSASIETVISDGRVYGRAALDALLVSAEH
ncbi:amidohydrolase family protein [Stigmatella aurantiaca]|nr:amidohydrolase family protein [Stigmatella aurantiaca]